MHMIHAKCQNWHCPYETKSINPDESSHNGTVPVSITTIKEDKRFFFSNFNRLFNHGWQCEVAIVPCRIPSLTLALI